MTALKEVLIIVMVLALLSAGCLLVRQGGVPEPQPAPEDVHIDIPSLPPDTTASPAPTLPADEYCAEYVTGRYELLGAMPLTPDAGCFEIYRKKAPSSFGKQVCIYEDAKVLYVEAADSDVLCCLAYYGPVKCDQNKDPDCIPCETGGVPANLN